jgi:diguanylate cyclase
MDPSSRHAGAPAGPGATNVLPAGTQAPAMIAKAALRRLAMSKLEPTPENYARA